MIGALLLALMAARPAPLAAEGELAQAVKNRQIFLADQARQAVRANWILLIKEFEDAALAQFEPRHASKARYLGGGLALDSGARFNQKADYEKAAQLARRAVRDCPRCSHAAGAQLVEGRALLALNQLEQAARQLMKVELNHPASPEVAEARKLLARIHGGSPPAPAAAAGAVNKEAPPAPRPAVAAPPSAPPQPPPPPPRSRADGQAQVYALKLSDNGPYTTVTAWVDKVTPYVYNLIPPGKPGGAFRVYADLKGAVIAPGAKLQLPDKSALVGLVKINQYKDDVVRVVLDLTADHPYRPTFLNNPPRLVFQVARSSANLPEPGTEAQPDLPALKAAAPARPAAPKSPAPSRGPEDSLARQLGLKIRRVVIDPGHGGKDNGATGHGLKEKDIALKLSRKLAGRLEKRLGLTAVLTRDEDKFITLERRTKIAKDQRADLFISIHVNANNLSQVEGFETYILNFPTDRSAMAVAARENAENEKSRAEFQDILHIIARNTKIADSRALAQTLHKSALNTLNKKYKVRDLGVKEAPFYVLVGTEVPAILVEAGFVTNPDDAALLGDESYLDLVADGLYQGLKSYVASF
jgi:N-acetylmuramoyl-L-alanine amidase